MATWIFFGLAWLALVINHSIDILERLNAYFKQLCCGHKPEEQSASGEDDSTQTTLEESKDTKDPPKPE